MADLLMDTFNKNGVDTQRMLNKQKDKIRKRYNKKNMPSEPELTDKAYEEFVSDALTDMLTDGSIVNFIAEVKQKNKSLGKKLLDAIKNLLSSWGIIIDDYKGRELETDEAQALSQFEDVFKKLQEMYEKALMDADAAYAAVGNVQAQKNTTGEGDVKFADRTFSEQVDAVLNGEDTVSTHLRISEHTPQILLDLGLNDKALLITSVHTKTAVGEKVRNKNTHYVSKDILKKLPQLIEKPAIVMESTTKGSIVMFVNAVDLNNNPVVCAIKVDGKGFYNSVEIESNIVTSVYGKDTNPIGFIEKAVAENRLLYWDKKMSQKLFDIPRLQLPNNIYNFDSNVIIRKINETVKENSEKLYSERDYSYESLTNKPDMLITSVNDKVKYKPTSTIRKNIVSQAIKNATSFGIINENGNVVIHVDDIDTDVILSKNSLVHGLDRRLEISAPVILNIGSVLKNSIRINELTPKKQSASASYVLIGYAESATHAYPVRMVVNQYTNEVDTIDVLYAVNTKKETVGKMPGSHGNAALPTVSMISISNLLDYVNKNFTDVLPEGVLKHFGYESRPEGDLGENILFSERDTSTSNRSILANSLESAAQNDIERKKLAQYKEKISLIEAEEKRLAEIQKQLFTKGAVEPAQKKTEPILKDEFGFDYGLQKKNFRRFCV